MEEEKKKFKKKITDPTTHMLNLFLILILYLSSIMSISGLLYIYKYIDFFIFEIIFIVTSIAFGIVFVFFILYEIYLRLTYNWEFDFDKDIINKGTKSKGEVIDVYEYDINQYKYLIKLEDGNVISTHACRTNFFEEMGKKECTVYKYLGRYYFKDFR